METCPGDGVVKEEKFPHSRKPLTGGSVGSFGISEGNITGRKKKKSHRVCTQPQLQQTSAQALASVTSKQWLDREAWTA